jgi:ABC-type sugar transport system substrate-binding protein
VAEALVELGAVYNFNLEQRTANGDSDAYINNLTTTLLKGPDGIFVDITQEYAPRVSELLEEYEVPAICMFNKAVDVDGKVLIPCVIMDQYLNGQTQLQWMLDNYKTYWGDIDFSKVAFMSLDWSTNMDLNMRSQGSSDMWKELYPNNPYFYADTAAESFSVEAGYNVANAVLSAHPEIEYWFISGTAEDYTLGAARAVDALTMTDRVIMTSSGAAILSGEWDTGYDGPWKANYSAPPWLYAGITTFGLLALVDGRATKETLWPESFLPGDLAPRLVLMPEMMTRDNYKDYLSNIKASFGC